MSLDRAHFCYIGSSIGWVSALLYFAILLTIKQITILIEIDKAGDKVLLSDNHQVNLTHLLCT